MKFVILAALVAATPCAVTAQTLQPSMNGINYSIWNLQAHSALPSRGITPTMARDKLRRAIALREEVAALQVSDGGTLTRDHIAYVKRRAEAIRAFRH